MSSTKEQVLTFLEKCDEIKSCKFIMATTKIKDLLKCIVNCSDIYRLFEAVTNNFDYPDCKSRCLISSGDGVFGRSYVVLPQTVGQRLAFIFCLLVEFDKDAINFNDFLRTYFPEDGSYFASYRAFCNVIIKSLEECINQVFGEELAAADPPAIDLSAKTGEVLSALKVALSQEYDFILKRDIPDDDKQNGLKILSAINSAIKSGDEETLEGLLCGYNYFVLHLNCVSDGLAELISLCGEYINKK